MNQLKKILVLISFFALFAMFTGAVSAANLTVNPGDNIQSVINNASDNDTIIINDNNGTAYTYTENLFINKKLQLQAKEGGNVTFQAADPSLPVFNITSTGSGSGIFRLHVKGAVDSAGIFLECANNCKIENSTIIDNGVGICLSNSNNNIISGNTGTGNDGGIGLSNSSDNIISGNTVTGNEIGIILYDSNNNEISGNTVTGIYLSNSNKNIISGNTGTGNDGGIGLYDSNNNEISGNTVTGIYLSNSSDNIISGNTVMDNIEFGIGLSNSSDNIISGNTVTGNGVGIGLYDSSDNIISGNTVMDNIEFGICLYDSNNNENEISGNTVMDNIEFGICLYDSNNNENEISGNTVMDNIEFGICIINSNCTSISGNTVKGNSVGIGLIYSNCTSISGNTVTDNRVPGIGLIYSNCTSISGNTVTGNGLGICLSCSNDNNIIYGNSITNNKGDGIYLDSSSADVNFNRIVGNGRYGLWSDRYSTVDATNNWWGSNNPIASSTGPGDIYIAGGTVTYNPWFSADIEFTIGNITDAAGSVKTYIETSNQLPNYVTISGIQVSMPQFLKLATTAVLDINSDLNTTIILGSFGNAPTPTENITNGVILDAEYLDIANNVKSFMDSNRCAPSYVSNTSLGNYMGFESLVYMYSQILDSYSTNKTLPDYITLTPWIAVSNPNGTYNFRTQKLFNTIQAAIDDVDTQNDDTITLGSRTFTENVIINKRLNIKPLFENSTIVNAVNPNLPVFTVGINGSGSIILNLIINGSTGNAGIYINNSSNNTISGNNITNNLNGIYLDNSIKNDILGNSVTNNSADGVFINTSSNITVSDNTLKFNNHNGININSSSNITISTNIISNNSMDGIYLYNSLAEINFNSIVGNSIYGFYNEGNGTVNATNNWWGTNNPIISLNSTGDIYIGGATVKCDQWLVLNITSSCDRSNRTGSCYNYIITADLTHNNPGNDTSSDGNLPDEIPIYFNTTLGTINTPISTQNGRAVATLNSTTPSIANVSATLDNQTVSKTVNIVGVDILGIYNNRNNEGFSSIQAAIDDADTINGDFITLGNGTYTENVIVNKRLTLRPVTGENVTIYAADPNVYVFTITSAGCGSIIQGFSVIGAINSTGIYLNSTDNCNITGNIISDNDCGIYLNNTNNSAITGNTVISNFEGICLDNSTSNGISGNNVKNNLDGIYLYNSNNNTISENTLTGNWNGIYLYNSNNTVITGNNVTDNDFGIYFYNSNSTTITGNNVTGNSGGDISQVNTTGIVMATTSYNCGPATLATVLNNMGINATEEELASLAGTNETGTTMYGLVQAAQAKGLIAKGMRLSVDQLRPNNIVVLTVNGENHFSIIKNITNSTVYLADTDLGNINMTLENFTAVYSGYALVVTNNTNNTQFNNGTVLTTEEMQNIKGKRVWIAVWVYGWFWSWWRWAYGEFWSFYGNPNGSTYLFGKHPACWHYVYGWFYIYYWHIEYIWWSGKTLPRNYVRLFTPRRTYENLHRWGDTRR